MHSPMNQESLLATIKSKFDLGYIVVLENGEEAQLRVLEQKGRVLEAHLAGVEIELFGETLNVYVVYRDEKLCAVSQFSPTERAQREEVSKKREIARINCEIGSRYIFKIEKELEWGYLCEQVNGFLSGAIKKPTINLELGQQVEAIVVGKSAIGQPYLEIPGQTKSA